MTLLKTKIKCELDNIIFLDTQRIRKCSGFPNAEEKLKIKWRTKAKRKRVISRTSHSDSEWINQKNIFFRLDVTVRIQESIKYTNKQDERTRKFSNQYLFESPNTT